MNKCLNKADKNFKFLAQHNDVSIDQLDIITQKYWRELGNEDYFPTSIYIQAQKGIGQYQEPSKEIREFWEKKYKKPQIFSTVEEVKVAKEEATKYFPASAITYTINHDGKFVLRVKEPVETIKYNLDYFVDKDEYTQQETFDYNLVTGNKEKKVIGPQRFVFKDGTEVTAPFRLNFQQADALNAMSDFINSDETHMTLSGYAGTGKTSLMEMLAQKMRKQHKPVVFCATTNKAAAVLNSRVTKAGFNATTLNKIFGISVEVDSTKSYNAKNLVNVLKEVKIDPGTTVIIDETSMINEENYRILNDIAKQLHLKIIYVGDAGQLAPVKERQISKVFRDTSGTIKKLSIVERTEDNAILKEATNIRNGEPLSYESSFNQEGKGVAYVKESNKAAKRAIVEKFVPALKENPDYFRILAYTNTAVTQYNKAVRETLGYTDNIPRVNEPLVGYTNWGWNDRTRNYRFINSEAYKVVKVDAPQKASITVDGKEYHMEYVPVTAKSSMGEMDTFKYMDIKDNSENLKVATILAQKKKELWDKWRHAGNRSAKDIIRGEINSIEQFLFVNDNIEDTSRTLEDGSHPLLQQKVVDFGYAMTVHKSQGSTFTHVMVDDADIAKAKTKTSFDPTNALSLSPVGLENIPTSDMNVSDVEDIDLGDLSNVSEASNTKAANIRQQLEYVAVSRATDTVTIITNDADVKKEDSPLNHVKEKSQNNSTINQQESRFNKTANLISATIAPYFNTSYKDYVAMTPEKQKEMREAFASAAKRVASVLGITLDMKKASFNIGGYEFNIGTESIVEPSFTFRFDTTPENARLFAALIGDLGYEQQEAVISQYKVNNYEDGNCIRHSIVIKDANKILKELESFGIKNFTYDKTNGVLSVLNFKEEDINKFANLVEKLKKEGYELQTKQTPIQSDLLEKSDREALYRERLRAAERGDSRGQSPELLSLIQEALGKVRYYSGTPSSYEGMITPDANTVFVFGSNPKGIHGAGAAAIAKSQFGAIQGQGEGMQGNAYALPTKDLDKAKGTRWYKPSKKEETEVKEWYKTHDYSEVQNHPLNAERTMTPQQIIESIKKLYEVASQNPDKQFKVSYYPFGQLSLNGYLGEEMLAMFKQAGQIPSNIIFNKEWTDHWSEIASQTPIENSIGNQTEDKTTSPIEDKTSMENTTEKRAKEIIQQKLGSIGELNQKINNLYESNLLPASEVLHVSELIMNSISDDVTKLQENPELAKQWFPTLSTDVDFKTADRKQIIQAVGIDRLIQAAKKNFDSSEHDYDDLATELQADLITENWDAIVAFGVNTFIINEGFGIKMDYKNGGYVLADGMRLGFDDLNEYQDEDDLRETEGDEQEHWQIAQRTLDILNTASTAIRMAIHECYRTNKDGSYVVSKWGIKERVNPREAVNSILSWTQGALTLDDMVARLTERQIQNPWLSQLLTKLKSVEGQENPNADFQSQFFNTMCRSFQSYSVVSVDGGKYVAMPVNDHPSLSDITREIKAQVQIKEHPLFMDDGREHINKSLLGSNETARAKDFTLHKGLYELTGIVEKLKRDEALTDEMLQNAKDNISGILKILGYTPSEEILDSILNKDTIQDMTKYTKFIVDSLDKALEEQLAGKQYEPFKFKGRNSIEGSLRNLLTPITNALDEVIPNVVYDDGKLYQAYVTPSYLTLLFEKFHWDTEKRQEFMLQEYGGSEWFKYAGTSPETGWRNRWLQMLYENSKSAELFAHKVELNFNKHRYMKNMTDAEYTLSVLVHYFSEDASGKDAMAPAWFRVPIQSNKPSSEFIRFWSYRGENYKESIVDGMYDMFLQEVNRIQTVKLRGLTKDRDGFIKSFDENGQKFNFLPYLNVYLSKGNKEAQTLLKDKDGISAKKRNAQLATLLQNIESLDPLKKEGELRPLVKDAIESYMQERGNQILEDYEKTGVLEAAKSIKGIYPSEITKKEDQTQWVRNQLENFIWNDHFAANNILQLTIGDKAAYGSAEELQKRLAELHAPGIRPNVKATDYEGNRVSDGKYRTILLKDFDSFTSNIIANLEEVFNREIERAPKEEQDAWKALKEDLIGKNGKFRSINVVDGQGYSSPSSYRKKAFMFGKWSKEAEQVYQRLKEGDYTLKDIETAFQPLKPFVYTQLHKDMGVPNAPITNMPIPFQAKNSEYLLIMADALMQGQRTGRPNLLRALYRVMEDSELLNPTKGIDTVQFDSAIKSGNQGAIDINDFMHLPGGEEAAYAYMTNLLYQKDANGELSREYNTQTYVHEAPYESYCLQQEVPAHFKNHTQAHGSQERMIIPSDLVATLNGETVYYEWTDPDGTKRKATAKEFGDEYENTIADNINASIKQLKNELKLESSNIKEKNLALSEILQKEILDSSRYGIDMFLACGLNPETGEFRIPLGDPIQSKRIEQLINSIIKNRVNKQEIAGGPIVQVSNWGTSKQLHIRFKHKNGGLLLTKEEYDGWEPATHQTYEEYVKENQDGIAYYEVFAPAWSKELFEKFRDKDGNIDIGAIEILNPDLLKMISYRIPTEEKYSIAPMKVVGFMPQRAGDAIMFPYELTEIDDSDFDIDKRYVIRKDIHIGTRFEPKEGESASEAEKDYIKHNKKSLAKELQRAVNLTGKTTEAERTQIEKNAESIAEVDRRTAKRAHEERLATIDRRNAMIEEAEDNATYSKNAEKNEAIYDKRVERQENRYQKALEKEEKRYQVELDKIDAKKNDTILKEMSRLERQKVRDRIEQFLEIDRWQNSSQDDNLTRQLRIAYLRYMYPTYEETEGKIANDNKIVDMTWGVLTNSAITSQLLNPGGFDNLKKIGYMVAAFKNPNNTKSWQELEKMSISDLKKLHDEEKDLAWIDTQVQFYRQNAAAASLIGVFAVNKVAHAMLERDPFFIDVNYFCGKEPFTIADKTFGDMMEIDPTHDQEGTMIGKTIGSGVSASADAAKTPVLHLMNINMTTVNLFTTLLRLGMPAKDAGLFLSQQVISDVLNEFNRKNLNNYEPLSNIIQLRLMALAKENNVAEDSNINTQELSREELIEGLSNTKHSEIDYKVLLAFQKIQALAEAMRKPTFSTRFNSISSAVGPQIVDNLILEHKMEQFGATEDETGFCLADGTPISINDVFEAHPVLRAFAESVDIAKGIFRGMPTGSTGFRNLLNELPGNLGEAFFRDKKLLSDLSNFYQSFLLIHSGLIDEKNLGNSLENFPKRFVEVDAEGKTLKDKYPDNALIQNLKLISSKKTGRTFLTINITGEDETKKDSYRTAWIDLHKKDPKLSQELFEYFFFRAGIGFSPKTGMALVPTFVKERLNANGVAYTDIFRKLPSLEKLNKLVIDQFIRNNWNESRLVPKKGGEGTNYKIDKAAGRLTAYTKEDLTDLQNVVYMRTTENGQTFLWKLIGNESDAENQEHRVYMRIKPLGDNAEYLEMSTKDIVKPYTETLKDSEEIETSDLQVKSQEETQAEETTEIKPKESEISKGMEMIAEGIMKQWEASGYNNTKEQALERAQSIKGKEKMYGPFLVNVFDKLGIKYSKEEAIEAFKKLC